MSFNVTAPAIPGGYNLQMQMWHTAGSQYILPTGGTCAAPGSNTLFGQIGSIGFTVTSGGNPPWADLDYPAQGSTVSGTTPIQGWALDNLIVSESAIQVINVYIDGNFYGSLGPASFTVRNDICGTWPGRPNCPNVGYSTPWNSLTVANGVHTFQTFAVDGSGQVGASNVHFVTVNNTNPPNLGLDLPAIGSTISGTVNIQGWALDSASSPESPINRTEVYLDGALYATYLPGSGPSPVRADICNIWPARPGCPNVGFGGSFNTTVFSNGVHSMYARSYDSNGQNNVSATNSFTINNGGNITVACTAPVAICPLASWTLNGPSPASGSGAAPQVYTNRLLGSYSLTAGSVAGFTAVVSPAGAQSLVSGGSLNFNIQYVPVVGAISAQANVSPGSWQIRNNVNALVASGSGTAPVVSALPVTENPYTFTAVPTSGWVTLGARYNGAGPFASPYSFTVTAAAASLVAEYSQPAPNPPSGIQQELAQCGQLRISFQDNNNVPYPENGFEVYYSLSNGGPRTFLGYVGALAGSGTRGYYTWTTPPAGTPVWFAVFAYNQYGPTIVYSPAAWSPASYTAQACYPDLTSSSKQIYQVNGAAYNSSTSGVNGDIVTYRITLQNNGTDKLNVSSIIDNFRPNPTDDGQPARLVAPPGGMSPRPGCSTATGTYYLCIDKDADGIYNEAGETGTVTGVAPDLTINISGVKCTTSNNTGCSSATDPSCITAPAPLCNNWTILLSAQVSTPVDALQSSAWNTAHVFYNYPIGSPVSQEQILNSPAFLINTGKPKVPDFREISP